MPGGGGVKGGGRGRPVSRIALARNAVHSPAACVPLCYTLQQLNRAWPVRIFGFAHRLMRSLSLAVPLNIAHI